MPAKNIYHAVVVQSLVADGWTITHDPLTVTFGGKDLFVDLGAERAIAAEKGGRKIAVEIQSFLSQSPVRDLEEAVGQYEIYRAVLEQAEPDREVFLAVPLRVYEGIFSERFGQFVVGRFKLKLLVFDDQTQGIVQWIS